MPLLYLFWHYGICGVVFFCR